MVTVNGVEVAFEGTRLKAKCKFSSSGSSWVGFCLYCKNECPLKGKPMSEFVEAMRVG